MVIRDLKLVLFLLTDHSELHMWVVPVYFQFCDSTQTVSKVSAESAGLGTSLPQVGAMWVVFHNKLLFKHFVSWAPLQIVL